MDDEIAAIWGMGGDILSDVGRPWLMTAMPIERIPVSFVKIAQREIAAMNDVKPRLENYVDATYRKAARLLETLGFCLDPPVLIGPKRAPFRRFWIGD